MAKTQSRKTFTYPQEMRFLKEWTSEDVVTACVITQNLKAAQCLKMFLSVFMFSNINLNDFLSPEELSIVQQIVLSLVKNHYSCSIGILQNSISNSVQNNQIKIELPQEPIKDQLNEKKNKFKNLIDKA